MREGEVMDANLVRLKPANNTSRILALIGAGSLFIGVFAPILAIPIAGRRSYMNLWRGEAIVLMGLAFLSLAFCFLRKLEQLFDCTP